MCNMDSFNKVALLGKGHLGTAVLEQLVGNGFTVTVLSRNPSRVKDLPLGVEIVQVDYSAHNSIIEALRGQDVVVATFGTTAIASQKGIIDASIEAGVKRYIPADYTSLSTDPKAKTLPTNYPFIDIQEYIKEKADEGSIEYTILSVGAFLHFVTDSPFILDRDTHSIQLYDHGEHPFSTTRVSTIGRAIAGALKSPEKTKNRNLFIHDTVLTQSKVLALAKKYSPPDVEWTVKRLDAQKELDQSLQNMEKNPTDMGFVFSLLRAALFGGNYRSAYPEVDNETVGVPLLTDEELEDIFEARFQKA